MDNGDKGSPREIREVDRGGDYHRNGNNNNNNDNKRNGNNNCYNRPSRKNCQLRKAPLVGWRNGSPTKCTSSVQNSAYAEIVKLDLTNEEYLTEMPTSLELNSGQNTPSNNLGASNVHEDQSKLKVGLDKQAWDSIGYENLCKRKHSCSIAMEEKERKKQKMPDGGWGWMVVLASLVISMIADGVSFSFGLLYIEFLHEFNASKSTTAWIGSLFMAVPLLSGPVMSALVDRYGCRKMTIVGGLISGLGFILSSFANSIGVMYLTFGVIAGLGLGLCYVTAVVSIAYWFDKKRTLAMGLGACGTGIGTFVYAPMTTYLVQEYGWRGTCLLLAGTFFNMIVSGVVMRDPEWWVLKRKQDQAALKKSHSRSDDTKSEVSPDEFPDIDELQELLRSNQFEYFVQSLNTTTAAGVADTKGKTSFRSVVNLPTFVKRSEKVPLETLELLLSNSRLYTTILENYPSILLCRSSSDKQLHDSTGEIPSKSGITMSVRLVINNATLLRVPHLVYT